MSDLSDKEQQLVHEALSTYKELHSLPWEAFHKDKRYFEVADRLVSLETEIYAGSNQLYLAYKRELNRLARPMR